MVLEVLLAFLLAVPQAPAVLLPTEPAAALPRQGKSLDDKSLDDLKTDLRDKYDDKRQSAVRKLAAMGTKEAFELVLQALEDRSSQVADEAQLRLVEFTNPKLAVQLLGKAGLEAKDEFVALRVAEALGRSQVPVPGLALLHEACSSKDADFARTLLWSVERLAVSGQLADAADPELVESLQTALKRLGSGAARGAALNALAAVAPQAAAARCPELLLDKDPATRAAVVRLCAPLANQLGASALHLLESASADSARATRVAAVETLEALGNQTSARLLVQRLELEDNASLRWRLVGALQRLSGRKHRLDVRPWKAWAEALPADWTSSAAAGSDAGAGRDLGESKSQLVGLPILSERVCFLVDLSGSVWEQREGGVTRKSLIDAHLRETLEALGPQVHFNLIPYTSAPIPWSAELQAATPQNVKKALEFFERCNAQGKGNIFDAIQLAASDPEVDTIVQLGDGAPTGGRRWNLDLMVELLVEQNRYRQLCFDSIVVDATPKLFSHWAELGARTGGRAIRVELLPAEAPAGGGQ